LECSWFLGLKLLEDEDTKRWNAVFDNRLPKFRTFLLKRYNWVFEDQRLTFLVRAVRPYLKERFQHETRIMLDLFPVNPHLEFKSVEDFALLYMEPLLAQLHEWSDAHAGLAGMGMTRKTNATFMRACYAFREASAEESKRA